MLRGRTNEDVRGTGDIVVLFTNGVMDERAVMGLDLFECCYQHHLVRVLYSLIIIFITRYKYFYLPFSPAFRCGSK